MKDKKGNKRKLVSIFVIILVLLIAIVSVVVIVNSMKNNQNNNTGVNNNEAGQNANLSSKMSEYMNSLTDNYYIKYSGSFKNNYGEVVNTVIEYTKAGKNYALKATDLDMHIICENDTLYSISHIYQMIVSMNKESVDIREYNLVSNIGQNFVKEYKEVVNNIEYDVEEYDFKGNIIKYYFYANDIKLIKYNLNEIKIIRVEKNTNNNLFVKPQGYTNA